MIMARSAGTRSCRRETEMQAGSRVFPGRRLMGNGDRRAVRDRAEEVLRHEFGHPNAAVRGWITWEVARMKPDTAYHAHEIGHRCTFKTSTGRLRVFVHVDVGHDDVIRGVHVIAIQV